MNLILMTMFEKIEQEKIDLILKLRGEGLSYRAIEKKVGVSRETARNYCLELLSEEALASLERKKEAQRKKKERKVNVVSKTRRKPKPQHTSVRDYDFLQYIRVVFRWALSNHDELTKGKLEMLLFLYPKGAFSFSEFYKFHKTISLYQRKTLDELIKSGYIYLWRPKSGKQVALYALTNKAKDLCDKMHKYCVGDEELPTEPKENKLFDRSGKRINNYFADMIVDMNKRKGKSN